MTDQNNQPIHRLRRGRLSVSIFENVSREGETYPSISFDRSYLDGDEWKRTKSFRQSDLLALSKLIDQADTWIEEQKQEDAQAPAPEV